MRNTCGVYAIYMPACVDTELGAPVPRSALVIAYGPTVGRQSQYIPLGAMVCVAVRLTARGYCPSWGHPSGCGGQCWWGRVGGKGGGGCVVTMCVVVPLPVIYLRFAQQMLLPVRVIRSHGLEIQRMCDRSSHALATYVWTCLSVLHSLCLPHIPHKAPRVCTPAVTA